MFFLTKHKLKRALDTLHRDERGDEGVNKILIIALIVVPLIIILLAFGRDIQVWFQEAWDNITGAERIPGEE